jgi:hypothetical protein
LICYYPKLYAYGIKLVPFSDFVRDQIQDLFINIWQNREGLGDVSNLKAYLFTSLRRKLFNSKNKRYTNSVDSLSEQDYQAWVFEAIYADGNDSSIIDVISEKTLMERVGETTWQKYIYPGEFFNLPDGAEITKAYFHFTNEDQSIIVRDNSGNDFLITETCN